MKMVKSLLLGTAAGLVAMTGAQAADLPVKAKPVQYVKICSLYGAGFYYIPGTDMCLKVGGWVRAEYMWGYNGNTTQTWGNDVNNRATNNLVWRARGYITADARNQSEYGTIRSYIAVGLSTTTTGLNNAANQFDANRAFIQFAGFTFGRSQSFYEFYNSPAVSLSGAFPDSGTGDPGWEVLAYTMQFGNGLSASISAEQRRMTQIINMNTGAILAGSGGGNLGAGGFSTAGSTVSGAGAYGGWQVPDLVGNLRVDQAWGGAQIMGALHQVNGTYYGATLENSGHPSDAWGWVIGAGLKLNSPLGPGDYFQAQVNYTQGALRYIFFNPNTNFYMQRGNQVAFGVLSDGIYGGTIAGGNASNVELTTAWNFNASYEHFWQKNLRTSVHGGYAAVSYNTNANAQLCSFYGSGAGTGTTAVAAAGCNSNWSTWWIGSRSQWNITPDTFLAVDVVYESMNPRTSSTGVTGGLTTASASCPAGGCALVRLDNWQARFRVHRDFYP